MKSKKTISNNLDKIWSEAVKEVAGGRCEICMKNTTLNSHHIFSRSNRSVRWDLDNGICLWVAHHTFGNFSAHKSPIEFIEKLKEMRGEDWYERLRAKARKVWHKDIELTQKYLLTQINEHREATDI